MTVFNRIRSASYVVTTARSAEASFGRTSSGGDCSSSAVRLGSTAPELSNLSVSVCATCFAEWTIQARGSASRFSSTSTLSSLYTVGLASFSSRSTLWSGSATAGTTMYRTFRRSSKGESSPCGTTSVSW